MPAVRNEALTFDGSLYLPLAGGTMSGSIQVANDNTIDLGTTLAAWSAVYTRTLSSSGALAITGPAALSITSIGALSMASSAAVAIDAGTGISIGGSTATGVAIGRAGITTEVKGKLRYDNVGAATVATAGTVVINVAGVDYKLQLYT